PISIFLNHSDLYKSQLSKKVTGPLSEEQIVSYGQGYFMDFKEEGFYSLIRPKNIYKKAYDELLPEYGYLLYMRATTSEYNGNEYIVLQYWHHYLYNAFVNDHEGDWEMVEILLDKSTQDPQYAAYSQHDDSFYRNGGQIKDWANVQKEGNHSVVYVAKGSHASYFEAGNFNLLKWIKNMADWTSSFGRSINFSEFNQTIILRDDADRTTQKWLSYSGRWGGVFIHTDTDMIGTNGPTGPAQKEEKWNHPAEWGLKYLTEIPELKYNAVKLKRGILTVIDDLNRKVTFLNNKIINKIPKAEVVSVIGESFYILPWITPDNTLMSMSLNAQGAPANYTYIIEANETYEFELYLANETEAMHIMFYNVSAEKDTKDTVWIEGNKIYMNTGDALKSLDVVLEYMTDAGEINTTLKGIKFHADETLVIEILDWTKVNEIGNVLINVGKKKCRLKDEGCTKIISKESLITGLLLKIFGPGDKELIHWNNRSGKVIGKYF
ncbi:MAG: hypothetical protein KAT91_04080, partial [Candidatus Aenigmarchaeota archaeon]|nr:hypothetical protein [Candidatus Aenigmarchaeota archaeon]